MPIPMYEVRDLRGVEIAQRFYNHQLAKIEPNDSMFKVEKVLERKGKKLLVKWLGYPKEFNTWITRREAKGLSTT